MHEQRPSGGKCSGQVPPSASLELFNLLVPVDPRPEAQDMAVDLKLRSGVEVTARVRTSDGRPLGTYYVLGAGNENAWMEQNEDRFTIVGCYPEETRRLFLYQPERNLVAFADVTGVPPEPIEIRLRPGRRSSAGCWTRKGIPSRVRVSNLRIMTLRAVVGHLAEMKRDRRHASQWRRFSRPTRRDVSRSKVSFPD